MASATTLNECHCHEWLAKLELPRHHADASTHKLVTLHISTDLHLIMKLHASI